MHNLTKKDMKKKLLTSIFTITTMLNLFGQSTKLQKKDLSKIFPIIKISQSTNSETFDFKNNDQLVFKELAGDLLCFYGIDKGTHFSLILNKQLPEDISLEKLDELAHENLVKGFRKKIEMHETDFGGIGLTCGGDFEASLITINGVLDIMAEELGNNLILAVPAKDFIIFVNGDDQKAIDGLKQMISEIHKDGDNLLSKKLYIYKDGKVEVKP